MNTLLMRLRRTRRPRMVAAPEGMRSAAARWLLLVGLAGLASAGSSRAMEVNAPSVLRLAQDEAVAVVPRAEEVGARLAQLPGGVRITSGAIEVHYWPGGQAMAERALRAADTPLRLPGIGEAVPPPAATIAIAPNPQAFDLLTGGAPHWSAGIAVPSERLIVLPGYSSARTPLGEPLSALRHEMVHLALNAHLPGRIPRWFDEGYATWASGEWDAGRGWEIRVALLTGGAPPLDSLILGWPGRQGDARLAYLLSASAVSFLAEQGGPQSFAAFFDAWRDLGDFDQALRSTYGMTLGGFEEAWRQMVRRRYGWLLALSQVGVMWALVAALLVFITLPRRRRNREKLQQMRVDEWVEAWADEVAAIDARVGEVGGAVREESSAS